MAAEKRQTVERTVGSNDGALRFLEARGMPLAAVVLAVFDQSDDCIKLIDVDGKLQFMNCNGMQAMEVDDFGGISGQPWESLWPAETQGQVRDAIAEARTGNVSRFEAFCPTAKGEPRWWDVTVTPVRDRQGMVAALLSSSRDITDRKTREESLGLVAAEMKHRLRNAYTVGAAVSMALAKDQPEHKDFAGEIAGRMMRLANAQSTLVDVGKASLSSVIDMVLQGFNDRDLVQVGPLPDVELGEELTKALALVLGELSTNSVKYGALSGRGWVQINAKEDAETITLDWREEHGTLGPALDLSKIAGGTGRQLMERMLASVGGHMDSTVTDTGFQARILVRKR